MSPAPTLQSKPLTKPLTKSPIQSQPAKSMPARPALAPRSPVAGKLSWRQRFGHWQPSSRLVKMVLVWWLVVMVATALDMTAGFAVAGLAALAAPLLTVCYIALALLAILSVLDILCLLMLSQVSNYALSRSYPNNVPIYHELEIIVYLSFIAQSSAHSAGKTQRLVALLQKLGVAHALTLDFYDEYPDQLSPLTPMPVRVTLPLSVHQKNNGQAADIATLKIAYPVLPIVRGTGYFGVAHLRVCSPLNWFRRSLAISAADSANSVAHSADSLSANATTNKDQDQYLRVLADFSGLMSNQLSAIFEKSVQAGVQAMMQQGHGSDFLKLREYTAGDAIRQIDWKASARLRRMMSKAYEDDNDQNVVLLLDCGEQMRHQDHYDNASDIDAALQTDIIETTLSQASRGEGSMATPLSQIQQGNYFDKVLNAVLLLAYIANKQNDKVGLMTFGGSDIYLPPTKGPALIRNMLNETADIKPSMQTSDYLLAAQQLSKRLNKRSVVVVITNTRAEASQELLEALKLLGRKHKVVFANLMEQTLVERLHGDTIPNTLDDALLYHTLVDYEHGREQLQAQISQQTGALCLQTTAHKLPLTLTQAYLSLKR